jgi:AcrR family transcriptional regulator
MNEKLQELLKKAKDVFMRCGLKSVTMDDVSRELGISKKTLYQHVSDKSDLIMKSVEEDLTENKSRVEEVMMKDQNAIEQLLEVNKVVSEKMKQMHPSIIFDMQKYYPEAWSLIAEHRQKFVVEIIQRNLELGIKEGLYRQDINVKLIARLYTSKMEIMTNEMLFHSGEFNQEAVFQEFLKYHFFGVLNEKGKKYFLKRLDLNVNE